MPCREKLQMLKYLLHYIKFSAQIACVKRQAFYIYSLRNVSL